MNGITKLCRCLVCRQKAYVKFYLFLVFLSSDNALPSLLSVVQSLSYLFLSLLLRSCSFVLYSVCIESQMHITEDKDYCLCVWGFRNGAVTATNNFFKASHVALGIPMFLVDTVYVEDSNGIKIIYGGKISVICYEIS